MPGKSREKLRILDKADGLPSDVEAIAPDKRERIRVAMLDVLLGLASDAKLKLTRRAVRERAKVDMRQVSPVMRAFEDGAMPHLGHSWGGTPAAAGDSSADDDQDDVFAKRQALADLILSASTDEERERVAHEIAAAVVLGVLSTDEARALKQQLGEGRQSAKAQREAGTTEDPERMVLAGPEAYQIVRLWQGLTDEAAKRRVLEVLTNVSKDRNCPPANLAVLGS
ncbi:hypothetical protein OAX78_02315 [Planctomycetota bacterium]|nr:hypothetical protein [Planctomycetota bacterium]